MYTHDWQKSSYSAQGNNCLEIAATHADELRVRESDEPGLVLTAPAARLRALVRVVKAGSLPPR